MGVLFHQQPDDRALTASKLLFGYLQHWKISSLSLEESVYSQNTERRFGFWSPIFINNFPKYAFIRKISPVTYNSNQLSLISPMFSAIVFGHYKY